MAQFYASIQGNRSEATRMGTKDSGMRGHIRGWNIGAEVEMSHTSEGDFCRIYATGGSNRPSGKLIAIISPDGIIHLHTEVDEVKVNA